MTAASESNYRAIFNAVNDAIFIHDPQTGRILDVNKKMSEMYGYTAEEASLLNVEAVSSGEWPYVQEEAIRLITKAAEGEPQLFEWQAKDRQGRVFWVEVNLKHALIGGKDLLLSVVRDISDRKRIDDLLERERGIFFTLLQKAPYGVVLMDKDEAFLYINPEYTAITGYTLKDVPTRKHWLEKAYPDTQYRAEVRKVWRKDFAKKGVGRVFSIVCKSGEVKQTEFKPTFLDDGRSVMALIDITKQKQAEETLRRSTEALGAILNGVYDAIFIHELDGTIIDVNDKMLELYKVSRERAAKLSIIADYSSPDNPVDRLPGLWKGVIAGNNHFFEWKARRPDDGSVFDAEVFLRKLSLHKKDVILATVRDITERKRVENAIKESEERHRTLVESSSDAILMISTQRIIVSCNRAFLDMFGYERDDVEGKSLRLIHPTEESFEKFGEITYPIIEKSGTFRTEWNLIRKDGTSFPGETVTSAIRTPEGLLTGYVSIIRDSTERKMTEDAIRQRNWELTALNTIIASLSSSLEIADVLSTLKTLFAKQLEIPGGMIVLDDPVHEQLTVGSYWGIPDAIVAQLKEFASSLFHQKVFTAKDLLFEPDFRAIPQLKTIALVGECKEWQSFVCIPLPAKGETHGIACLFTRSPHELSPDRVSFLITLGKQIGVAIQNARLFEQVKASGEQMRYLSRSLVQVQETERRFIATELHDEVGQLLTGLKLLLETRSSSLGEGNDGGLPEAQKIVNHLMKVVRELSLKLRPAILDDLGLLPALLWHLERFTAQTNIHVNLGHSELSDRFCAEVETAAYRIVQEALTNIARHAGTDEASVWLWSDGKTLGVQVEDHGIGFDAEGVLQAGTSSGLAGMRERAMLLGGQFSVDSAPDAGTRVSALLPLNGLSIEEEQR